MIALTFPRAEAAATARPLGVGAGLALGPAATDLLDLHAIYAPFQNVKGRLRDLCETRLYSVQRLLDPVKSSFD